MSAPMKLSPDELRNLAAALTGLARIRREYDVIIDPYDAPMLAIGDAIVRISWDSETEMYWVDDRNGQ